MALSIQGVSGAFATAPSSPASPVTPIRQAGVSPVRGNSGISYSSIQNPSDWKNAGTQAAPPLPSATPTTSTQVPIIRQPLFGEPGELLITEPLFRQTPEDATREGERIAAEQEKLRDDSDGCETCKSRSYQDGSTDPGVSFKTPTQVDPSAAASMVKSHEQEHVTRNQIKAQREQREIISQTVQLHNAICPECGTIYVSGGTTRTTSRAAAAKQQYSSLTGQGEQLLSKTA